MKHILPTEILYISGTLPDRSETFVYREIFALRALGLIIRTASVKQSVIGLGTDDLDSLARSSIQIYSNGNLSLFFDAFAEAFLSPFRAIKTISQVVIDASCSPGLAIERRLKILWQGMAGLALARRLRYLNIKHIHAHMAHVPTTIAMYASKQLKISFSFTGHANDLFPNRTLLKEKITRALFINCISYWHHDFYRGFAEKIDKSLPIIRCGIDTNLIKLSNIQHKRKLKVLSIGRLVKKKGFDVLVKAARLIAERGIFDFSFTIAGSGPEESNLKILISSLPTSAYVEMIGEIQNEKALRLMGEFDIFALPCRVSESGDRDGIPVVLMEAMSRGRCVIAGDLPPIRELITSNVSGFLIPLGDELALAKLLEELAVNHELIDNIGAAARKRIEEEFDLKLNAQRIMDTLRIHDVISVNEK